MTTRSYLDVRFDVTDLTEDERAALAGEVVVQSEASDYDSDGTGGHPSVEYEIEWNDVELDGSASAAASVTAGPPPRPISERASRAMVEASSRFLRGGKSDG